VYRVRRLGYRLLGRRLDYLLLLRPRQWPILTCQLAVGVLLSARSDRFLDSGVRGEALLLTWLAWVLALNGGTLAYNSAWDRDESAVAYLDDPPPPPPHLAAFALSLMVAGVAIAALVSRPLALLTAACVILSVLYSHPRTRGKGIPGVDLLINMVGYGGGTTLAGLLTAAAAVGAPARPSPGGWWLCTGFALLFGSFYPLTQLYQLDDDRRRGDRTLALALGVRWSLVLALLLGAAASACLLVAIRRLGGSVLWPAAPLSLWLGWLGLWWIRAPRLAPPDHARGMMTALGLWALLDAGLVAGRLMG